ncbi:MAG: GCN5-related N-acetyltransferase [Symbiobacteriaceae bacterium]|nr:GCN5-related N-acetyltransferase [Symbiobacteriaceae bacterium]
MHYRTVAADEIQKFSQAEQYCFFIDPTDYQPFVDRKMKPEELRGIFSDEGDLLAGLINFPYELYMSGAKVGMGAIAGVVSWPEHRRGGNVGELLIRLMHEEKEKGVPLSGLYPFKQAFYRRYGWEIASAWLTHEIPPEQLAPYRRAEGHVRRFAPGTVDWQVLERIYKAKFAGHLGYKVRETESAWADWPFWGPPAHTAVWYPSPGAEPQGYLIYRFWKDDKGEQALVARELAALTPAAERGLWGYVAQHDSQVRTVRYRTPRDYPVWHLAENTRDVKSTLDAGWMLRFVDFQAAFEQRPWPGAPDASFVIGVADEHLPWNNGTFRLTFEAGRCKVTPAAAETPVLTADQRTWVQIYSGLVRPDQAVRTDHLRCTNLDALHKLVRAIAGQEMWFYEYF